MPSLFVSHSSQDDQITTELYNRLTASGIDAWVDHIKEEEKGIKPGDTWPQVLHKAVNEATCGLFVLSKKSCKSSYCEAEWNSLLPPKKHLFVAMIEPINEEDIPLRLRTIQYVRLYMDYEKELTELITAIQNYLGITISPILSKPVKPSKRRVKQPAKNITPITVEHPLLIGVLFDLSRSMLQLLDQMPKQSGLSRQKLSEAINILVEKSLAFCKTPEADEILPRFALFTYGYGFGKMRQTVIKVLNRIGITSNEFGPDNVPTSNIRDLFAEYSEKSGLPATPNAATLYKNWSEYRKSFEAQFLDAGMGESFLETGLNAAYQRFTTEATNNSYSNMMLVVIGDGQLDDANDNQLASTVDKLHNLGVQIVCCYIGDKNITEYKTLYSEEVSTWNNGVKRLFRCSSQVSDVNQITNSIIQVALENHWKIIDDSRLFIEVNNTKMIEELVNLLTSPLKTK